MNENSAMQWLSWFLDVILSLFTFSNAIGLMAVWVAFCVVAGPVIFYRNRRKYWRAYNEQRALWKSGIVQKEEEK